MLSQILHFNNVGRSKLVLEAFINFCRGDVSSVMGQLVTPSGLCAGRGAVQGLCRVAPSFPFSALIQT